MKTKKEHISAEDFRRYMEDRMSNAERNRFERELQKNPFEAEALEGFSHIPVTDMQKDLQELKHKITSKKRRNKYSYWAAAASLLLILSSGVIWYTLNEKPVIPEVAQTTTQQQPDEQETNDKTAQPAVAEDTGMLQKATNGAEQSDLNAAEMPAQKQLKSDSGTKKMVAAEAPSSSVKGITDGQTQIETYEEAAESISRSGNSSTQQPAYSLLSSEPSIPRHMQIMRGKIVSADDSTPLPGATIWQKGTQNAIVSDAEGKFELNIVGDSSNPVVASFVGMETAEIKPATDSFQVIALQPEQIALDEIVITGHGTQAKRELTSSVSTVKIYEDTKARPEAGMDSLNNYLEKQAVLPADYPKEREVVKLLLTINEYGEITKILNRNKSDSLLFNQAKEIIRNGPNWLPEVKDGERIASERKMKIIFRK